MTKLKKKELYARIILSPIQLLNYFSCGNCWIETEGENIIELGCENCDNDCNTFNCIQYIKYSKLKQLINSDFIH